MAVHYLETGSTDPCYNLALEQYVLEHRREGEWLMLWQNANTVVIGLNQNTAEEIDAAFVEAHGITVVRRMTGGGAVYHDLGNLNYSFICDVGNAEELSIRRFTEPVCRALAAMGVEAETSGRNDIVVDGKKVSGVAQRIAGGRILHHGTLLFRSDPTMIAGALHADPAKFQSKSAKSVRARVGNLADYLPEGTGLQEFWEKLLQELTPEGLVRETLSE
ncbi:MAG: lipoate--protein ligase family protein, partial [Candidatus Limivicinus sp.]